jgi:hypothetical protein
MPTAGWPTSRGCTCDQKEQVHLSIFCSAMSYFLKREADLCRVLSGEMPRLPWRLMIAYNYHDRPEDEYLEAVYARSTDSITLYYVNAMILSVEQATDPSRSVGTPKVLRNSYNDSPQ